MFYVFFAGFLKVIALGAGFQHKFSALRFLTFFVPEGGEFALSKNSPGDGQAWN